MTAWIADEAFEDDAPSGRRSPRATVARERIPHGRRNDPAGADSIGFWFVFRR